MLEAAGFDNHRDQHLDTREEEVVHCSALVPYHADDRTLETHARGMEASVAVDNLGAMAADKEVIVELSVRPLARPSVTLPETDAGDFRRLLRGGHKAKGPEPCRAGRDGVPGGATESGTLYLSRE